MIARLRAWWRPDTLSRVAHLRQWYASEPHIAPLKLPEVKPSARIIEPHEANILQFVGKRSA